MIRYSIENDSDVILQKAVREAGAGASSRVLNIACEFLRVPPALKEMLDPTNVFGLEINRELVEKDPQIRYCDVDKDAFPFPDASFDLVISIFGVEHFQTPNVFREARRVLKPGGRFVFLIPNLLYPAFLLNRFLGEGFASFYYQRIMRSSYRPHAAHYRFNTLGAIKRVAANAEFSNASLHFFGPSHILNYVRRIPLGPALVRLLERLLTNAILFRFKPYILAELVR